MQYPSDFTEEMRKQGICGVLAIAVAAGVTMAEAHDACKRNLTPEQKRHVRRTFDPQIAAALRDLGKEVTDYPIARRQTLRGWVADQMPPYETLLVFVSGHVMVVRDGLVLDQVACDFTPAHPASRRFVTQVWKIR